MSLNLIFHRSDFHNLKIVNNIFFFIFEGGLIFLSKCVYTNECVCVCVNSSMWGVMIICYILTFDSQLMSIS